MSKVTDKQLDIYMKTEEGKIFARHILRQIFDSFKVVNGKIISAVMKESFNIVVDIDEIEKAVRRRQKRGQ